MSTGKKQSAEPTTTTKRLFSKLLRKKKDGGGKKKNDEDDMRTCEEGPGSGIDASAASGSPISIKPKRRKKKKDIKEGVTCDEDETLKGKKSKEDLQSTKKKKTSRGARPDRTEDNAAPQPSVMPTVFEAVKAPSRPAIANTKDMNEHIKEDMQRIDKEEKKEKEKQAAAEAAISPAQTPPKATDEIAPAVLEPVHPGIQPANSSTKVKKQSRQAISPEPDAREQRPVYLSIPKENLPVTGREKKDCQNNINNKPNQSAESTKTGTEQSNKAPKPSANSQDDADCKTALIPASAVKVASYQMQMYKGVPRYEPLPGARPYEKSDKEVAAKIQILPQPSAPTSPTLPAANNYHKIQTPPPKSPSSGTPPPPPPPAVAVSPGKNNNNAAGGAGGIVIGTLPKAQHQSSDNPKKDPKDSPVSHYIAPVDR